MKNGSVKPVFSRNEDINKIAFLNWRMEFGDVNNLFNLADGYFQSASLLTEACLVDNHDKKADIIIFPILACFNHGIELYLKASTLTVTSCLTMTRKLEAHIT